MTEKEPSNESDEKNLLDQYAREKRSGLIREYWSFLLHGKRWYAAVYGAYAGKSQAQNAVATLPPEVGKNPPWIRQFASIQKIIKTP